MEALNDLFAFDRLDMVFLNKDALRRTFLKHLDVDCFKDTVQYVDINTSDDHQHQACTQPVGMNDGTHVAVVILVGVTRVLRQQERSLDK